MKIEAEARLVTIVINSSDQWEDQPLYSAIVQLCQEQGIAGATVSRCIEGYGSGRQLHTTRLLDLSDDLPVRIDIVDLPERIEPFLTALEAIIGAGLVAISNVRMLHFVPDSKG